MGKKDNLEFRPVSAGHYSTRQTAVKTIPATRLEVHVVQAEDLLATDRETGKSDPICFIALSNHDVEPDWSASDLASVV